ncbi:hypothetical protein [Burkholderia stagnalis]|uniref:hypothetical protein n=1 Tax=Burkholderia stagnalis TaxID=1503054 RepID=UPI00075A8E79|nr:hypothetical protein [Burkholderia stagnalis]KVL83949.1 hypothetical protein WT02_34070 [Burkholderia stagnalis]KVL95983.1 hypothetical protein WT03_11445 [Burkholderia stagnalis]KVM00994.1 hypothetical protein WT04_33845 [Burkholderia stagnalis]RQQ51695.1 hypothetical protein DF145_10825 [Burkholderia stagnalis]RQY03103.1 hypothetical protein DF121_08995 [Burkholderia stagnalis]
MKRLLLLGLTLSASSAFAANPVLLETPVTYAPDASVIKQVRDECHIEDLLTHRVGDVLRRNNRKGNGLLASEADATTLRLQIMNVFGVGGGAWSGPKALTVSADLLEGGKVVRHTTVKRWSIGGIWGGFKGTCSILDRTAIFISKDLGRWVRDPSYVIKEEAPPAEASAPAAQSAPETAEPAAKPE